MTVAKTSSFATARDWLQTGVLIVGALVGTYQFYLKDVLSPARAPTALDVAARIEKVGEKDGKLLMKVVVAATNPTDRRIYVPAFWFTVRGSRLEGADAFSTSEFTERVRTGEQLVTRYLPNPKSEIVAERRIISDGLAWWEPNDKTNDEAIFTIPQGKFDYLELQVFYLHTRDISVLTTPAWFVGDDGALSAHLQFKTRDDAKPELFDVTNSRHLKWADEAAAGINWYVSTLSLWPTALTKTERSAKQQ
ncbi:MAG: hypothetical protein HY308_14555 [Gammaproteobacteria bacterium]|nr:hypothetical protein [Gammaproteobacteria bacterium]